MIANLWGRRADGKVEHISDQLLPEAVLSPSSHHTDLTGRLTRAREGVGQLLQL
jgi:hypothetical protein